MIGARIWSVKDEIQERDADTSLTVYHEKESAEYKTLYTDEKMQFMSSRDYTWCPRNKRPDKLKDTLKEVEVCFRYSSIENLHTIFLGLTSKQCMYHVEMAQ